MPPTQFLPTDLSFMRISGLQLYGQGITHTMDYCHHPSPTRMSPARDDAKAKKEKKERKETQRCDKSHICPDHLRCATSTKVVMWGGVLDVVNHARFRQNRFCFGCLRGRNLSFSYAWRYGLGESYRSTSDSRKIFFYKVLKIQGHINSFFL